MYQIETVIDRSLNRFNGSRPPISMKKNDCLRIFSKLINKFGILMYITHNIFRYAKSKGTCRDR